MRRALRRRLRHVAEISGGLLVANAGDSISAFVISVFLGFIKGNTYILALLPALSALRGSNATSMAARVTSSLYIGDVPARVRAILSREAARTFTAGLLATLYVALLVWVSVGFRIRLPLLVVTGILSAVVALLFIIPSTAMLAVLGFRHGFNPDNYMASVITVLGDAITVPSLVLAAMVAQHLGGFLAGGAILAAYLVLAGSFTLLLGYPPHRRVLGETLTALLLVGVIESQTGSLLDRHTSELIGLGVLPIVPSLMEDIGAALSVYASRTTTLLHLASLSDAVRETPYVLAEVAVGSIPAVFTLAGVGYLFGAHIAGLRVGFSFLLGEIAVLWGLLLVVFLPVVLGLVYVAVKANLDPDNFTVPLITSLVDVSTVPTILLVARLIH